MTLKTKKTPTSDERSSYKGHKTKKHHINTIRDKEAKEQIKDELLQNPRRNRNRVDSVSVTTPICRGGAGNCWSPVVGEST